MVTSPNELAIIRGRGEGDGRRIELISEGKEPETTEISEAFNDAKIEGDDLSDLPVDDYTHSYNREPTLGANSMLPVR